MCFFLNANGLVTGTSGRYFHISGSQNYASRSLQCRYSLISDWYIQQNIGNVIECIIGRKYLRCQLVWQFSLLTLSGIEIHPFHVRAKSGWAEPTVREMNMFSIWNMVLYMWHWNNGDKQSIKWHNGPFHSVPSGIY